MDSTSSNSALLMSIDTILNEWYACDRKGKIILHSDGNCIKKIEINYSLEI